MNDFYCERLFSGLEAVSVLHEDPKIVAYHHTRPFFVNAHIVVVPRQHIDSLLDPQADTHLPSMLQVVRDVARQVLEEYGAARVLTNLGAYQDSKHLHWHVCSGDRVANPGPRPHIGNERQLDPAGSVSSGPMPA